MNPNPWGIIVIGIGILMIILGVKGSYSNFVSALKSGAGKSTTSNTNQPAPARPRPVLSI